MNIFVSGINHKTTPLDIREKLSFTTGEQKELLKEIKTISGVSECVILSTCNRTEVYIHSESSGFEGEKIESLLCNVKGFDLYEFKKYFYFYTSSRAVSHAFKVASGLDSQVLGEDQILTQVKDAHSLALECGTSSVVLNTLFREIVTCAKRIKTYTSLSRNSISVGSLAVGLVSDFFAGKLDKKCALVIGTGKIGAISLKYLISAGVGKIYITNRTHGRADSLSRIHGAVTVIDYNSRYSVMNECDIIISSTSSPHYTITRDVLEHSIHEFKERVIVDLAVPRDVDQGVTEVSGIKYFNMDHLKITLDENIDKRLLEVPKAEKIIDEFLTQYERWYELRSVLPVIRDIQKYVTDLVEERVGASLSKLKSVDEEDKEVIKAAVNGIVNDIMNKFVYSVKECGNMDDISTYFRCLDSVIKDEQD